MDQVLAAMAVIATVFMAWGAGSLAALEYLACFSVGAPSDDEDR